MYTLFRSIVTNIIITVVRVLYHDSKVVKAKFDRLFRNRPTVLEVHRGNALFPNGPHAIFLIWQPQDFPWYVKNALAALNENGINVLAVVNHRLSEDRLSELREWTSNILIRNNSGFDIGGYRDATLFLLQNEKPKRVIYLNDSVYFFKDGLSELMKRLSQSDSDIVGSFENWQHHYHIQSFCFSVSDHVFTSEKFAEFWRDYLPVNSRLWAINRGEIELSKAMVPIARSIETVYSPNNLRNGLSNLSHLNLVSINAFLPKSVRLCIEDLGELPKSALVDEYCRRITAGSQIHTGGFFYRKFLQCPMIKRDLLYRLQSGIYEIEQHLAESGDKKHANAILTDMRKKGPGNQLPFLQRLMFHRGII